MLRVGLAASHAETATPPMLLHGLIGARRAECALHDAAAGSHERY
jgi:hypothetical protein